MEYKTLGNEIIKIEENEVRGCHDTYLWKGFELGFYYEEFRFKYFS